MILIFILLYCMALVRCGHEVLYGIKLTRHDIQPSELLVAQFDNRPIADYWNTSSRWNKDYCDRHGHQYKFLTMTNKKCSYGSNELAWPWCKVKAMVALSSMKLEGVRAVLFIDSDSILTVNYSMTVVLAYMQRDLEWNITERPLVFNQDGPGWACKNAIGVGYDVCLNSGTISLPSFFRADVLPGAVLWLQSSSIAKEILQKWWISSGDTYGTTNKFPQKWKTKWPWEQAQQYEMFNRYRGSIQLLSFPSKPFLPWLSTKNPKSQYPTDYVEPWCFSHWPGANCFITHHCSSKTQKAKLRDVYNLPYDDIVVDIVDIDPL